MEDVISRMQPRQRLSAAIRTNTSLNGSGKTGCPGPMKIEIMALSRKAGLIIKIKPYDSRKSHYKIVSLLFTEEAHAS